VIINVAWALRVCSHDTGDKKDFLNSLIQTVGLDRSMRSLAGLHAYGYPCDWEAFILNRNAVLANPALNRAFCYNSTPLGELAFYHH
jgi:hypothetical protein